LAETIKRKEECDEKMIYNVWTDGEEEEGNESNVLLV